MVNNILSWNSNLSIGETIYRIFVKTSPRVYFDVIHLQEISDTVENYKKGNIHIMFKRKRDKTGLLTYETKSFMDSIRLVMNEKDHIKYKHLKRDITKPYHIYDVNIIINEIYIKYKMIKYCWVNKYDCTQTDTKENSCGQHNIVSLFKWNNSQDFKIFSYPCIETLYKGIQLTGNNWFLDDYIKDQFSSRKNSKKCKYTSYRNTFGVVIGDVEYVNIHNAHGNDAIFNIFGILLSKLRHRKDHEFLMVGDMNINLQKYHRKELIEYLMKKSSTVLIHNESKGTHGKDGDKTLDWGVCSFHKYSVQVMNFHDTHHYVRGVGRFSRSIIGPVPILDNKDHMGIWLSRVNNNNSYNISHHIPEEVKTTGTINRIKFTVRHLKSIFEKIYNRYSKGKYVNHPQYRTSQMKKYMFDLIDLCVKNSIFSNRSFDVFLEEHVKYRYKFIYEYVKSKKDIYTFFMGTFTQTFSIQLKNTEGIVLDMLNEFKFM